MKIRFSSLYILLVVVLLLLGQGAYAASSLVALLLHEGAHALVARHYGYRLDTVKLQPYGAQLDGDLSGMTPREEINIALAGPLCSGAIAALFTAMWWSVPSVYELTKSFVLANASIALVNLLPVYPMDGGRVLYAVLCMRLPSSKALKAVSIVGLVFGGLACIAFCVGLFFGVNFTLAVMGVFMLASAVGGVRGSRYATVKNFVGRNRDKSLPVKMIAVPETRTLLEAMRLLCGRSYTMLVITNAYGAVVTTADEARLISWMMNFPADTVLSDIIMQRKSLPTK